MESIREIGTKIGELGPKTYGSFLLFGVIIVAAILLASYAFPDEDEDVS